MKLLLLAGVLGGLFPFGDARSEPMSPKDRVLAREEALYNGCMTDPESLRPVLQATNPVVDYSASAKNEDELKIIMSNPNIKANISRGKLVRKDSFDIKAYCECKKSAITKDDRLNTLAGSGDALFVATAEIENAATNRCLDEQISY